MFCKRLYSRHYDASLDSDEEISDRQNLPHDFLLRVTAKSGVFTDQDIV